MQRQQWVVQAACVGLAAGVISTGVIVAVGLMAKWPYLSAGRELQGVPAAIADVIASSGTLGYMLIRTVLYVAGAIGAFAVARLSDRFPTMLPVVLLVIIALELAYLGAITVSNALGRITELGWLALLIAHVIGDAFVVIAVVRAYPGLRATLDRAYEE